ncbi:hypothetical protein D3C76_876460 [compost metagenome]
MLGARPCHQALQAAEVVVLAQADYRALLVTCGVQAQFRDQLLGGMGGKFATECSLVRPYGFGDTVIGVVFKACDTQQLGVAVWFTYPALLAGAAATAVIVVVIAIERFIGWPQVLHLYGFVEQVPFVDLVIEPYIGGVRVGLPGGGEVVKVTVLVVDLAQWVIGTVQASLVRIGGFGQLAPGAITEQGGHGQLLAFEPITMVEGGFLDQLSQAVVLGQVGLHLG